MKTILRKATALFLSVLMCLSGIPLNVVADTVTDARTFTLANTVTVLRLTLDPSSAVIAVGATQTFTPTLEGGGGSIAAADCQWQSDTPGVATVDQGVVTGVSAGTAKITCSYTTTGGDKVSTSAMVTVTNANYRLVYESNYPEGAKKYIYQNGKTASVGDPVDTTVNETYEPGATATVAGDIFTTINYDLEYYKGSDGKKYNVGDPITMDSNLTLTAQWKANGNTTEQQTITVRYYKISNGYKYVDKTVTATFTSQGSNNATVTFITGNNQDTIEEGYDNFYGWSIGDEEYAFNEQVTTTATWRWTDWNGGYWLVEARPLQAKEVENVVHAQFFIRKADADGFGEADQYYSVGTGTVDTSTFERDYQTGEIISGTVAGADNVDGNVNEYILTAPSAAQIANLMNISLDEASAVRWYVIKNQADGYHVDGVIYLKDKYWKVEFIDPDSGSVVQTLLVPDSERIPVSDILNGSDLNTALREFQYWQDSKGNEANFNNTYVRADMQFTACFKRYSGYTVQHYLQNANNDGYSLDEEATETKNEETGKWVEATPEMYPGFTYNADKSTASGTVNSEGTLVLKLYYDRDQYTVAYEYEGSVPQEAHPAPQAKNYKQGATVSMAAVPTVAGYEFSGWKVKESDVTVTDGKFTMPAKNVTFVGTWKRTVFEGTPITVRVVKDGTQVPAKEVVTPKNLGNTTDFKATYQNDVYEIDYVYDNLNCADIKLDVNIPEGYLVQSVVSDLPGPTVGPDGSEANLVITGAGADWSLDNVPGGATVTVTLVKKTYTVKYEATEGGTVSQAKETVIHGNNAGGSKATATDGYYFVNWTDKNGEEVSSDATYAPKKVTADAIYTANFAKQTEITVKAKDLSKVYNGTAIAKDDSYDPTGSLAAGHRLVVTTKVSANVVNVGDHGEHLIDTIKVLNTDDQDVTYLYDIEVLPGTLKITERPVTLTSESASKEYDGTALTRPNVTVSEGSFVAGEVLKVEATGSVTEPDSKPNTIEITWSEGANANNYEITRNEGTLTVTKNTKEIVITANSDTKVYDGTALTNSGYTYTPDVLATGDTLKVVVEGSATNVGDAGENKVISYKVTNAEDEDVTEYYTFGESVDGKLTITERPVTITIENATHTYDGTLKTVTNQITNLEYTFEGENSDRGLLTGDAVSLIVVYGDDAAEGQSLVGEYFAYPKTGSIIISNENGDVTKNYAVKVISGLLKITDGTPEEPVDPDDVLTKQHAPGDYDLGDTVTFTITVKNIYNETKTITITELPNVKLDGADADGKLVFEDVAAGDTVTATATYTVTEADILAGVFTNTVTAAFSGGKTFENVDKVELVDPMPAATVVKEVVERGPVNRWGAMRTSYMLGETINYTFTITNTGNVTLTDLVLEDLVTSTSNPTGHAEQIVLDGVSLAPGEQTEATFAYTVQGSDLMPVYAADGTTRLTNEIHNRATLKAMGANQQPGDEPTSVESNEVTVTAEHYVRVRFIDNMDGTTLKDVYVMYGGSTTPPTRSERVPHNGYDFIGWVGGVWENVTSDQIIFTAHKMRDRWYPERDEDDDLVILDANIPLAGGYISNVGDCFD